MSDTSSHILSQIPQMEVWGGVEYTCNRVNDRYFDQMEFSGHGVRVGDYDEFAKLKLQTLRVGMLWERHDADPSWRWSDERLLRLRELQIRPIVGLLHHGSGPPHTNLLDPAFSTKLATYAREFAQRYPWIESYTPVNEPHTTARFSGMYGLWYPHSMSKRAYLQALVNQLKGTVLSMEAIRSVNPAARLIQTDDVGNISGTEEIRPIWELLSLRRWLPFDLLCGRVLPGHAMFDYMRGEGFSEAEILWFAEHPCPPDVLGINYYVTSDRFLDHRLNMYPETLRSADGPFADVEAVRADAQGLRGVDAILLEAWQRYRIPLAITEVHLGCTVDEQIRWLAEVWKGAMNARKQGVECIAITVWALLGSFYWNDLVTRENGHYEPGVYDVRGGIPQTTELAQVVTQLLQRKAPAHSALARAGWWRDPSRIAFPAIEIRG